MEDALPYKVDELLVKATTASAVDKMRKNAIQEHILSGIEKDKDIELLEHQLNNLKQQLNTKKQHNKVAELLKTYNHLQSIIDAYEQQQRNEKFNTFSIYWNAIASMDVDFE